MCEYFNFVTLFLITNQCMLILFPEANMTFRFRFSETVVFISVSLKPLQTSNRLSFLFVCFCFMLLFILVSVGIKNILAWWRPQTWVNIGSSSGLLPAVTNPLFIHRQRYHQRAYQCILVVMVSRSITKISENSKIIQITVKAQVSQWMKRK